VRQLITYDTSVQQIADFVEQTYITTITKATPATARLCAMTTRRRRSPTAQFAGRDVYWRMSPQCPAEYLQKTPAAKAALIRETEFAFKQAFAFCPYSPEAVYRYVNFLLQMAQTEEMTGHPIRPFTTLTTPFWSAKPAGNWIPTTRRSRPDQQRQELQKPGHRPRPGHQPG